MATRNRGVNSRKIWTIRASSYQHHHHHHRHRHHHNRARRGLPVWGRVLVVVLLVAVIALGALGAALYVSAREVIGKARAVQGQAQSLSQCLYEGDAEQARTLADKVNASIAQIQGEVDSPAWRIASYLPVVGHDISNARTLADCAGDLSQNALIPLVDGVAGIPLSELVREGAIDTGKLSSMRGTVVQVAPVVVSNAQIITSLTPGMVSQLNEVLESAHDPLTAAIDVLGDADGIFSVLLDLLGDGGQTRTYVVLALSNVEARPGGGFPGSVGLLQMTDGVVSLGDFETIRVLERPVKEHGFSAETSEDELQMFGPGLGAESSEITLTPDFARIGQIAKAQWENAFGTTVDGVVGVDPVFLQRILALVGSVTADDGTVVTGDNASYELQSNVYWRYGYEQDANAQEDEFFADVAEKSFSQLLDAMGDFDADTFGKLWQTMQVSGEERRLQVWMADETQQDYMRSFGISGTLQSDLSQPEIGFYATDYTWSKICWYLHISAELGEPVRNEDGTTSYAVTAHYRNSFTEEDAAIAPRYVVGGNPRKRSLSDMVERIYIMAPLGAAITDYQVHQDAPVDPENAEPDIHGTLYGRDTMVSYINILGGGDTTVTFTLTLPAGIDAVPVMRFMPVAQEE